MMARAVRIAMVAVLGLVAIRCAASPTAPKETPPVPFPQQQPPPPPPPPPPPVPRLRVTRLLAFGDSLTEGEATPALWGLRTPFAAGVSKSYPFKLQALVSERYTEQTIEVWNGGLGGDRATEARPRLIGLLDQFKPNVMILMIGVNDLNSGVSASRTIDAIADLVREATGRGAEVLLSTLPPQDPRGFRGGNAAAIPPFNADLKARAPGMNALIVDVFPLISLNMMAPDGLHLLQSANQTLAEAYFARIKERYELPVTTSLR
jgi:lysophospholipase L1-like esterase